MFNFNFITPRNIYLFHMFVVAPLLMYIGYNGSNVQPIIFNALIGLSIIVFLYHSNRLIQLSKKEN